MCSIRQAQALGSPPEPLGVSSTRLEEDPHLGREMPAVHLWILGLPQGAPEAPKIKKDKLGPGPVTWHISQYSCVNENYNQPWPRAYKTFHPQLVFTAQ